MVSRRHARLRVEGDRITLRDLGSQNGSWLNVERVQGEQRLQPGDHIGIGPQVSGWWSRSGLVALRDGGDPGDAWEAGGWLANQELVFLVGAAVVLARRDAH